MRKRAISILLTALMLFAMPFNVFADTSSWNNPPQVALKASNISGSEHDTLELSIVVTDSNFKALGAALEYDATVLKLIDWTPTEAAINVAGTTGWKNAAIVESKCPDKLSGKPALAYMDTEASKGYLYMGAESAAAQEITDATKVVTVRFGYVGAATFSAVTADTIKFATGKAAYESPAKGSMIYQTEDRDSGNSKFYYLNPLKENADGNGYEEDTDASSSGTIGGNTGGNTTPGAIDPEENGETVNSGSANVNDFVSITFYDWDKTLLGSRIVAKGDSLKDPNGADKTEYEALKAANGNVDLSDERLAELGFAPIAPSGETLEGGINKAGTATVTAISKENYEFAGWVDYYTGHTTPNVNMGVSGHASIPADDILPLTNVQNSMIVKTAYNEGAGIGTSAGQKRYNVDYSPFKSSGANLVSTFTITRKNTTRRAYEGETSLIMMLQPLGRGQTRVIIPLGASDIETYELQMPGSTYGNYNELSAISYYVVDNLNAQRTIPTSIKSVEIQPH